jgi:hypothetical protein
VIVILAALIAIAAPFALSMRLEERTARGFSAALRADMAARAARELAVRRLLDLHPDLERTRAVAEKKLADSPEDFTDPAALKVDLADLPGDAALLVRDPKGTILAAEIEDEQGKIDLNSAGGRLLGNLLGVAVLAKDIGSDARDIELEDPPPFFSDGDPETFDGLLEIDGELIAYRQVDGSTLKGCERGVFFSAPLPENLEHKKGALVRDARGGKIAATPFWLDLGAYLPFKTVASVRDIAGWQLVDAYVAGLFRSGYTVEDLRRLGLGGAEMRDLGAGRALDAEVRRRADLASVSATAEVSDELAQSLARVADRKEESATNGAVDAVLRRMGRSAGQQWLEKQLGAMGAGSGDGSVRQFVSMAQARLRQRDDYERKYFRDALALASRLRDVHDLETLSAREAAELRACLTVSSVRPAEWAGGALVQNRVEPLPDQQASTLVLGVDVNDAYGGGVARVEADGKLEHRRIAGYNRQRHVLTLFPQLEGTYEPDTARVFVAPRHPVNLNTAPLRVLRALFTGLEIAGANTEEGERDFVTPKKADAVARRIVAQPVKCYEDLFKLLEDAVVAKEITENERGAILWCAMDAGHPQLRGATAPMCFRSGGAATVIGTGIVNDKAGNELARRTFREVLAVSPPREATLHVDSQADFYYEAGEPIVIPGRRGNLVETRPAPIRARERGQNANLVIRYPNRSHEPGTGDVRAATGECPDAGTVEHYREDLDGRDLVKGGAESIAKASIPQVNDPEQVAAPPAFAQLGTLVNAAWPREVAAPGMIELWFQIPAPGGRHTIFDGGQGDFTDRIALFLDGNDLVFRVADGTLPSPARGGDPWLDSAEVRGPFQPRANVWYHVAACWKGTKAGDIALFLDGLLFGEQKGVARLASPLAQNGASLALDRPLPHGAPAAGALQVGTEVVEYESYAGGSAVQLVDRRDPKQVAQQGAQAPPPEGRGARGSQARAHAAGTTVEVWGYRNFFFPQVQLQAQAAQLLGRPNPLQTTRPDGSLWRGGAKIVQPVPKGTPIAVVKVAANATIGPTDTRIPVYLCPEDASGAAPGSLAAAGFPPHGFIQIEHELAYYGSLSTDAFENVKRFVAGRPMLPEEFLPPGWRAPRPIDTYCGYELVELASIEIDDPSDYPDAWWVALDDEIFHYYKASAVDWATLNPASNFDGSQAPNVLVTAAFPAEIRPGAANAAIPGRPSETYDGQSSDAWREYFGLQGRMNKGVLQASGANIPPWAFGPVDAHFHLGIDAARGLAGTQPGAHGAGTDARMVYALTRPYCGAGDQVTILDAAQTAQKRVPLEVRTAGQSVLRVVTGAAARQVRAFAIPTSVVAFKTLLPQGRSFTMQQGVRLLKHPSGGLPLEVPDAIAVGGPRQGGELPAREPQAPLGGRVDEVRIAPWAAPLASLEAAVVTPQEGAVFHGAQSVPVPTAPAHEAARGFRPAWDLNASPRAIGPGDTTIPCWTPYAGAVADRLNKQGAIFLADGEVIGASQADPSGWNAVRRGLLGTRPVAHSDEAVFFALPFPPAARLEQLGGANGEHVDCTTGSAPSGPFASEFASRGYLALDAANGQGIAELLPYERVNGTGFDRPRDDRARGAFRGAFGTAETPFGAGDLAYGFPFRFYDRYRVELESADAVFWQLSWTPPGAGASAGCLFRSLEWDEARPNGDVEVKVLARVDGAPPWDSKPTNKPGGLFLFDDPKKPNQLDVAGREIEVRLYFPLKKGAFARGTWKESARVDAVRVKYVAPVRVLAAEEADR